MTVLAPMVDEDPDTQALVTYKSAVGSVQVSTVEFTPSVVLDPASQVVKTYWLGSGSWHGLHAESEVVVHAVVV